MKKTLVALIVATSFSPSTSMAEQASSINDVGNTDLMKVYRDALSFDTQYKISEANLKATEQGVRISRSSLLPQISGSATRSRNDNDNTGQGLDGSPSDPFTGVSNSTNYRVQLSQSVFNWGNWISLDQSTLRLRASELNHASSLQDLMSRSTQAYFNVLSAEENLATTQAELEALEKQTDLTREQYEAGLANATDYLNAQANFDQSLANEVSLRNNLAIAEESLRQLTNKYYMALEGLGDEVKLAKPMPNNIDDWTRVATQENLGLKAQQMSTKVARQEIKRNKSGHYPSLDFNISYSDNDSDTERTFPNGVSGQNPLPPGTIFNSDSQSDGYNAGLTLSVPIFSGFRTSAQTEQAKQNYLSTSHQHEQTARLVQANVRNAFTGLQSAISSFEAYKRSLDSNQNSLEATQEGYQSGTRNIIDVLNSTRSYYNARRNLTRAKYNYLTNGVNLKLAAGTLTENDLAEINRLLLEF